ncbi:hypothetical protein A6U88_14050 [Agrobacterium sp. B131/95]|nr:hypothetical protein A6U88_14050 [Agrobacterium sp. B131/95]
MMIDLFRDPGPPIRYDIVDGPIALQIGRMAMLASALLKSPAFVIFLENTLPLGKISSTALLIK